MTRWLFLGLLLWVSGTVSAKTEMVRLTRYVDRRICAVEASSAVHVELIRSQQTKAVVELQAAYENDLIFDLSAEGVLTVDFKPGAKIRNSYCKVWVMLDDLQRFKLSGASSAAVVGVFDTKNLFVQLTGASRISGMSVRTTGNVQISCSGASSLRELKVDCRDIQVDVSGASDIGLNLNGNLSCDVSGASRVVVSGSAGRATIHCSGASAFAGKALMADDVHMQAKSASTICIGQVRKELTAVGTAASTILYNGDPTIRNITISSASTVKKEL